MISYNDDDGETSIIATDDELTEAIDFFNDGNDDAPQSSNSSVSSGRSTRKIYMNVDVNIEFDGRLSDTASLDEYRDESESRLSESLSLNSTTREFDDDDVTVSSRDYISASHLSMSQRLSGSGWQTVSHPEPIEEGVLEDLADQIQPCHEREMEPDASQLSPDSIEDSFADVDLQGSQEGDSTGMNLDPPAVNDRHAAWLREQTSLNSRTNLDDIQRKFQAHDSSSQLGSESLFSLEKDTRGKYYYSYTPASSNEYQEYDGYREEPQAEELDMHPRPSSMQMAWLASQRVASEEHTQITNDYEPPLPQNTTSAPPELVTECSHCGVLLETIRYMCSTCGPKSPAADAFSSGSASFSVSYSYPPTPARQSAYPLASSSPESPPTSGASTSSLIELQNLSLLHRSAPQKGKLRHAFREQMWESNKWIDLRTCTLISSGRLMTSVGRTR